MTTRYTSFGLVIIAMVLGSPASGQPPSRLSLSDAIAMAQSVSPDLRAASEAVAAARGREMQARAIANPSIVYSTERTPGSAGTSQHIIGLEQPLEVGGQRAARTRAATARRRAAEARAASARTVLAYDVATAYALAVSADRRAALARQAAGSFTTARTVSAQRLAAGDISVYADRRLSLESSRYLALEAEANLVRRSARLALGALISASPDTGIVAATILTDSIPPEGSRPDVAALRVAALERSDYIAATAELEALEAEAAVASRDRVPTPLLSAGMKTETTAENGDRSSGFAGGVSLPLPLFDRRKGAIEAASAEARRAAAEREGLRRRIVREVGDAVDALMAAERQRAVLAPQLGSQSSAALRSAEVAYAEGEITLLEWLDAVRAYHEAETSYANILAESAIRRAALERVIGRTMTGAVR